MDEKSVTIFMVKQCFKLIDNFLISLQTYGIALRLMFFRNISGSQRLLVGAIHYIRQWVASINALLKYNMIRVNVWGVNSLLNINGLQ